MKEKLLLIIFALIFVAFMGLKIYLKEQYKTTINALTSIESQYVTTFRIYPRVGKPFGTPIEFSAPDPMIVEFFQSLTDLHSYKPSHGSLASRDYEWFLEVTSKGDTIQISFLIPSGEGDIVAGQLGKFSKRGTISYGEFQSRQLFQWYQTYSHRWLSPPAATE